MAFTVDLLGIPGEQITDRFGVLRNGCPHKGTDFSTSRKETDFTAGIYGVVVFVGGEYSTIAVRPFHTEGFLVQYLHCSSFYVQVNDIVQPWTVIGRSGNIAPPDTGITGIHIHLQVHSLNTSPSYPCWNDRDFVDPETWNISNPLFGKWHVQTVTRPQGVIVEDNTTMILSDDRTGSSFTAESINKASMISPRSGQLYTLEYRYKWAGIVAGRQKHTLTLQTVSGSCSASASPARPGDRFPCTAQLSTFDVSLESATVLYVGPKRVKYNKISGDVLQDDVLPGSFNDDAVGKMKDSPEDIAQIMDVLLGVLGNSLSGFGQE